MKPVESRLKQNERILIGKSICGVVHGTSSPCYRIMPTLTTTLTRSFIPVADATQNDSKENVMPKFNRVHVLPTRSEKADAPMQSWDIKRLARGLYSLLKVHSSMLSTEKRNSPLDNMLKVRVMILCSVIERKLYSTSKATLVEFNDDFAACLSHVIEVFATEPGYSTIRLFTIGNCIRIMFCLKNPSPQISARFIKSLFVVIDCVSLAVPFAVIQYASQLIVRFTTLTKSATALLIGENKIDALLSILETTISSEDRRQSCKGLECLRQLAPVSSFASEIANRHDVVIGACRHLTATHSVRGRKTATDLVGILLLNNDLQLDNPLCRAISLEIIVDALRRASLQETNAKLQKRMVMKLVELLNKEGTDSKLLAIGMKSVLDLAFSGKLTEEVTIECAVSYLRAVRRSEDDGEILANVVDFTTSTFAMVRKHALGLLHDITFWNLNAPRNLLRNTVILECFAMILDQGWSDRDNGDVISICQQLLFDKGNEHLFLRSSNMITSLVTFITQDTIANRVVYVAAVDLVLNLLEDESNLPYFLRHSNILPWLIKTSNRTTDELLKERLVPIILRLSATLLEGNCLGSGGATIFAR